MTKTLLPRLLPLLLAGFCLGGCADLLQQEIDAEGQTANLDECIRVVAANPMLAKISGKVQIKPHTDMPFSMLDDKSLPTAAEIPAIQFWYDGRERCIARAMARRQIDPIGENSFYKLDALILNLTQGQTSYGDFNKARRKVNEEFMQQLKEQGGRR